MEMRITGNGSGKQLIFVEEIAPKVKRTTTVQLTQEMTDKIYSFLTAKTTIKPSTRINTEVVDLPHFSD